MSRDLTAATDPVMARTELRVTALKTEYVETPIGIDADAPRFSWCLIASGRNVRQQAYRIHAASSEARLAAGDVDLWDSGRVVSDQCFEVAYGGVPLVSGRRVFWRVEIWDENGREAAAASWFEMGLRRPADWRGVWLVAEDPLEVADRAAGARWIWADVAHDGEPVRFRFRFELAETPKRAELFLSAKDNLRGVWVNGGIVMVARPLYWGTMRRLPIELYRGTNVICVEANALVSDFLPPDGGALAAMIRIEATDGTLARLVTGSSWRASKNHDAGWEQPSFNDGCWPAAVPAKARMHCEPLPGYPARLLRRSFRIDRPVAQARLYATALGVYEAFINGQRISETRLAPEISVADDHLYYQAYNVTKLLGPGANAIGLHVADGWYGGALGWRNERYSLGDGPKRVLAQLVIDYEDGGREVVATDGAWRTEASPLLASDIYNGEVCDGCRDIPGWSSAGFDDGGWQPAVAGKAPTARLVPQIGPPIRAVKTLAAKAVKEVSPGTFVYDFGQNFSGWSRLSVQGPQGSKVTLRYAEILKQTGEIDQSNLRGAAATDSYILRGAPDGECFEPRFTYHGFRYVECHGPGKVEGIVAHSALPRTGSIKVANSLVQRICDNALWSQRSNFFGVPTDCPQRDERMGWLGDIQVFLDAASFGMDTDAFIRRFLDEIRAGQSPEGAFPVVVPQPRSFPFMHTAGWSEAGIILPYTLYERYGDTRVIDQNWDAMNRWMRFIEDANPDWLWRNRRGLDLGDWLSVDAVNPADETTPRMLAATAYWAYAAELMAKMAAATGRNEDAQRYDWQHRAIAGAFRAEFVAADGAIGNGSQAGYVLALKFGLVPEELRPAAAVHLAAEIAGRGVKLSTGFLGTPYLLDVLCDNGQTETAIALLLQTGYPSWGYMVEMGATTMWERWNGDVGDIAMNSYSHYAFGAVVGFIYRRLAGIAAAKPGFGTIAVNPLYDPRIGLVEAEYHSCVGRIATKVDGDEKGLSRLRLSVPANATARVWLPHRRDWRESGRVLAPGDGILSIGDEAEKIVLEVGSGDYRFEE